MKLMTLKFTAALLTVSVCTSTAFSQAEETEDQSTPEAKSANAPQSIKERFFQFFHADTYRASYGIGSLELMNPEGFDIDSSVYVDGFSNSSSSPQFLTWVGEQSVGWEGRQKSLWGLHYDNEDYNGLELQTLMANVGVAIDPSVAFALGGRLAVGVGAGLTRSESFFDSAFHPTGEVWGSAGVQLGRFTLDLTYRARQAMGADLDARTADPTTVARELSVGWVF